MSGTRLRQDYRFPITKPLEHALEAARSLPPDAQDDIARVVLQLVGDDAGPVALSPDERAAVPVSKATTACDEFSPYESVGHFL
jgi:hypothetical protein